MWRWRWFNSKERSYIDRRILQSFNFWEDLGLKMENSRGEMLIFSLVKRLRCLIFFFLLQIPIRRNVLLNFKSKSSFFRRGFRAPLEGQQAHSITNPPPYSVGMNSFVQLSFLCSTSNRPKVFVLWKAYSLISPKHTVRVRLPAVATFLKERKCVFL